MRSIRVSRSLVSSDGSVARASEGSVSCLAERVVCLLSRQDPPPNILRWNNAHPFDPTSLAKVFAFRVISRNFSVALTYVRMVLIISHVK